MSKQRIPLIRQAAALKSYFPTSKITRKGDQEITWIHDLHPTPLSSIYKVKLCYKKGKGIKISVLEPYPLLRAEGIPDLPHVYSNEKQELCLYYPRDKEWTPNMYYVTTIIPWISEWLLHYEIWVGTGIWTGGGIEHGPKETTNSELENASQIAS